jgi:hypothetical protein
MELIFNPENIYNFCVESSIAYFPGSNEWSAGVEVFVGDIIPSASLHTSDKFLFKTNEPFDYIPRDDFDALVREINFQSSVSSAVQTNQWGNYIINGCHASELQFYPNITYNLSQTSRFERRATVVYGPSDYIIPINENECALMIKPSDSGFHFGMTFFRYVGVHLLSDKIGICDPK